MPIKNWSDGDYVYGTDMDFITGSLVMRFANAGARDAALVGDLAPVAGMVVYQADTKRLYVFQGGTAWAQLSGPVAILRQRVGMAIPSQYPTSYAMTWDTEDFDILNGHSTGSFASRYVAPLAGYYEFNGATAFTADATGYRLNQWAKGGTAINGSAVTALPITGIATCVAARPLIVSLAVNEYVELQVMHTSTAGSYTTYGGAGVDAAYNSTMTVKYLGL